MNEFLENLKRQAAENPVLALGVAAGLITSISQLLNSTSWNLEVKRRRRKDAKKHR